MFIVFVFTQLKNLKIFLYIPTPIKHEVHVCFENICARNTEKKHNLHFAFIKNKMPMQSSILKLNVNTSSSIVKISIDNHFAMNVYPAYSQNCSTCLYL